MVSDRHLFNQIVHLRNEIFDAEWFRDDIILILFSITVCHSVVEKE
jgi:hypothetical protein